jgi:hypothetical protein
VRQNMACDRMYMYIERNLFGRLWLGSVIGCLYCVNHSSSSIDPCQCSVYSGTPQIRCQGL